MRTVRANGSSLGRPPRRAVRRSRAADRRGDGFLACCLPRASGLPRSSALLDRDVARSRLGYVPVSDIGPPSLARASRTLAPGRLRPVLIVSLSGPGVSASHHPQVVTSDTLLVLGLVRGVSAGQVACSASRVDQAARPWSRLPRCRLGTLPAARSCADLLWGLADARSPSAVFGFCRPTSRLSLAAAQTMRLSGR